LKIENIGTIYVSSFGNPESGTGYFKTSWLGDSIIPDMAKIKVTKNTKGIAWGGVYWQYFENLDKITSAKTGISIEKQLLCLKNEQKDEGTVWQVVSDTTILHIGDKIRARLILRSDRDLEFVHLKDLRASAFEPINVLSGYKYQGGLYYYESTRDAATNFFIDYLPKGTYNFEYTLTVSQSGIFSNGIATLQCMYAPEFSAHSEGIKVKIAMQKEE
jgi:hypothetical protein